MNEEIIRKKSTLILKLLVGYEVELLRQLKEITSQVRQSKTLDVLFPNLKPI